MNFKPFGDRVIVKPKEINTTRTGIIIPDSSQDKPLEGEVVAVGAKLTEDVKVGDLVVYGKYSGTEIEIEGETYLVMLTSDLFGARV
jgi:chaperonin GroES